MQSDAVKIGDETFVVLLDHTVTSGHIPCTRQLINIYGKYHSPIVCLKKADKTDKYKIIEGKKKVEDNIYRIKEITEKTQNPPSNLAVMGRYILTPDIFEKIDELTLVPAVKFI